MEFKEGYATATAAPLFRVCNDTFAHCVDLEDSASVGPRRAQSSRDSGA
jgi:hypothetical protein